MDSEETMITYFYLIFFKDSTIALFNFVCLSVVLRQFLFQKLNQDAILMAHLDPSEISTEPISLLVVLKVVSMSLIIYLPIATTVSSNFITSSTVKHDHAHSKEMISFLYRLLYGGVMCSTILLGGGLVFVCAILCGASPFSCVLQTWVASLYFGGVAFSPTLVRFNVNAAKGDGYSMIFFSYDVMIKVMFQANVSATWESHHFISYACTFGLIFSMILLTLDWGAQIQRWPVPMIVGTWVGLGIGVVLGVCLDIWRACIKKFKKSSLQE